jgi:hypothetical protein
MFRNRRKGEMEGRSAMWVEISSVNRHLASQVTKSHFHVQAYTLSPGRRCLVGDST